MDYRECGLISAVMQAAILMLVVLSALGSAVVTALFLALLVERLI